ncbi:MAG TPA: hypothetical protein VFM66_00150, partial [Agromyces sp.]|nr:hypothetical protein [Agromyces sp.]
MIRHRPFGSGHPYSIDTEQRSPVDPVAGEPVTLGVRATPDIVEVDAELVTVDRSGVRYDQRVGLERVARTSRGQTIDGGHLASAQARLARAAGGWAVTIDAPAAGNLLRYRMSGTTADGRVQRTRWFETRTSAWQPAADDVAGTVGASRVVPGSVAVLTDGDRVRRVRFALP